MNIGFELICKCGGMFRDRDLYFLKATETMICPLCGITDIRINFGPTAIEMAHIVYWGELLRSSIQARKEKDFEAAKHYAQEASHQLKLAEQELGIDPSDELMEPWG